MHNYRNPYLRIQVATFLSGVLAFAVAFGLVRHFILLGGSPSLGYDVDELTVIGWYFFNSHNVPLTEYATIAGESGVSAGHNLLANQAPSPYYEFLYLVPPIALFPFGLLATAAARNTQTLTMAMAAGASMVFGYLPATALGIFFFSVTESGFGMSATVRPDVLVGLVLAGVLYPIVIGAASGAVYYLSKGRIQIKVG